MNQIIQAALPGFRFQLWLQICAAYKTRTPRNTSGRFYSIYSRFDKLNDRAVAEPVEAAAIHLLRAIYPPGNALQHRGWGYIPSGRWNPHAASAGPSSM